MDESRILKKKKKKKVWLLRELERMRKKCVDVSGPDSANFWSSKRFTSIKESVSVDLFQQLPGFLAVLPERERKSYKLPHKATPSWNSPRFEDLCVLTPNVFAGIKILIEAESLCVRSTAGLSENQIAIGKKNGKNQGNDTN